MISEKDVTIVIPHLGANKDQCFSLSHCVRSLKESSPNIKILVVKNGNIGCTCDRDIRVLEQGQCKAVNAAVAITNTPWILITNDDMVYAPGWFERLTEPLTENMLCVSPMLVEPRPGAPTFEVMFAGGAGGDFNKEKWLDYAEKYMMDKVFFDQPGKGVRTGFNTPLLIRRDLWDLVGGYDVNYDPWGSNSDSDLEYKIKLAGIQPMQNTNCIVYHFSQTSGTFEPQNGSYYGRNFTYFKEKWGFDRTDNRIWEADFPIPTKEEGRIFTPYWENFYK